MLNNPKAYDLKFAKKLNPLEQLNYQIAWKEAQKLYEDRKKEAQGVAVEEEPEKKGNQFTPKRGAYSEEEIKDYFVKHSKEKYFQSGLAGLVQQGMITEDQKKKLLEDRALGHETATILK